MAPKSNKCIFSLLVAPVPVWALAISFVSGVLFQKLCISLNSSWTNSSVKDVDCVSTLEDEEKASLEDTKATLSNPTMEEVKNKECENEEESVSENSELYEEYEMIDYPVKNDYDINSDEPCKLVLCVNTSLSMGKGKMAAQCGHATLGAFLCTQKYCQSVMPLWYEFGQAKIAVKLPSEEEMDRVCQLAKEKGLVTYIIHDEGRTQIAAGSRTVLAIGPAPVSMFVGVSDHLKLL